MFRRWGLAAAGASALALLFATPAAGNAPSPVFTQVNQVSNQPGVAKLLDVDPAIAGGTDLINAWGLAFGPTTPLWVANNGTNTATIYPGGLGGAAVTKAGLIVHIDGGAPTGQIFNDTTDFTLPTATTPVPATFLFDSEGGDLTAWNRTATGTTAVVVAHVDGAVFKGLALAHTSIGNFLLAADFAGGRIVVFDKNFHQVPLPRFFFNDRRLPKGYAPFNVLTVGDKVYVAYAKQQAGSADEQAGAGLGFVDVYTHFGLRVRRIASHGPLNAPWGLAIAPTGWGKFTGALLVGNFGDGHISVYRGDDFIGQVRDASHHPIAIDGLWALLPGTATSGGVGTVWFSAGPNDESDGLVGQLIPGSS